MPEVTDDGVVNEHLDQWIDLVGSVFTGVYGPDMDISPETPHGQVIRGIALLFSRLGDLVVHVGNGLSPYDAVKYQLDANFELFG